MNKQIKNNFGRGKRNVTMEDVGRMAGVSQVTVSRALSNPAQVSTKTLAKIKEAIERTGFVPNAVAGALASRRSKLISVLVPDQVNIMYSLMIKTFAKNMRAEGYQILLSETGYTQEEEERTIALHLSRRPDAMVLTGVHHSAQSRRMLLSSGIPVVELWDISNTPIDICVGFSHMEIGRAVANYVIGKNYNGVATIFLSDLRAQQRKDAFIQVIEAQTNHTVLRVEPEMPTSIRIGREGLAKLLDEDGFRQGVVFCSSDLIAHGVIIEAQVRGLAVPQDIAVIGFGNQNFADYTNPALTSIRIDLDILGQKAANAIIDSLQQGKSQQTTIDIGFQVIERESS